VISRRGIFLSSEKVDKVLDEILSDIESSFFDSDNYSGIDDLQVGEAFTVERTKEEDSNNTQDAGVCLVLLRLHGRTRQITWGEENNLLVVMGPKMKQKMLLKMPMFSKCFLYTQELVVIIVCETTIYALCQEAL
jgi:hypothetical protein